MGLISSMFNTNSKEAHFVKTTVETNPIVIFGKSTCPYCRSAKNIFAEVGADVREFQLDKMSEGPALQDILGKMTSARTVPRVFINGQCIGGSSELKTLHQSGKLQQMLLTPSLTEMVF